MRHDFRLPIADDRNAAIGRTKVYSECKLCHGNSLAKHVTNVEAKMVC